MQMFCVAASDSSFLMTQQLGVLLLLLISSAEIEEDSAPLALLMKLNIGTAAAQTMNEWSRLEPIAARQVFPLFLHKAIIKAH